MAYLTLNRPEKKNVINPPYALSTHASNLIHVKENPEVWVAMLRANGDVFSTGHDLIVQAVTVQKGAAGTTMEMYIYLQRIWQAHNRRRKWFMPGPSGGFGPLL